MPKQNIEQILVLEDESDAGLLISSVMRSFGFDPIWVDSVSKAKLALQKSNSYKFLFLDYQLPDGYSTDIIHSPNINSNTPIVLCSAYLDDLKQNEVLNENVAAFLDKPINKEKIKAALKTLDVID